MYADTNFQIKYEKIPEKLATGLDKYDCKGSLGAPGLLRDLGISDDDVKNGTHCRKADFDGDGVSDYWFYKCDHQLMACKSDVLLMAKDKIQNKVHLSRSLENPEVLYVKDKKNQDYLTQFGCTRPPQDALVEEGDGEGKMNRIHVLNKSRTDFVESTHCATIESGD